MTSEFDMDAPVGPAICVLCGRSLGFSADDQPDWPAGPMCGDCYQAREMDNEIWAAELNAETIADDDSDDSMDDQ
jgi:hypothetical protein